MPVNRDDAEERRARIDMIVNDLRLTTDDLRERAKHATGRALQTAAESRTAPSSTLAPPVQATTPALV